MTETRSRHQDGKYAKEAPKQDNRVNLPAVVPDETIDGECRVEDGDTRNLLAAPGASVEYRGSGTLTLSAGARAVAYSGTVYALPGSEAGAHGTARMHLSGDAAGAVRSETALGVAYDDSELRVYSGHGLFFGDTTGYVHAGASADLYDRADVAAQAGSDVHDRR